MLISLEGLDGSGKTTIIEAIEGEFDDVVTTAEPSELWTGKQLRKCLSDETVDPLTDFYFFMGDRVNHIEDVIRPADENGKIVVSDRYSDSTRAYQPVALGESRHFDSQTAAKLFIEQTMASWRYKPDVTIYIDISVETALERCEQEEKYEKQEFLTKVKQNYDALVNTERERFIVIDGEQSKENVATEAIRKLKQEL
jgi:thymidylate kinase